MRLLALGIVAGLALVGAAALAGALAFLGGGISARNPPAALEAWAARTVRRLLLPAAARDLANPLAPSPGLLARAERHFEEHCAACHGSDGRGDTELGRGLHPRAPDLAQPATQALSDGELFWIIENGVRLTGMPAFGREGPEDDEHAWVLVHWIRRLPEPAPRKAAPERGPRQHSHP